MTPARSRRWAARTPPARRPQAAEALVAEPAGGPDRGRQPHDQPDAAALVGPPHQQPRRHRGGRRSTTPRWPPPSGGPSPTSTATRSTLSFTLRGRRPGDPSRPARQGVLRRRRRGRRSSRALAGRHPRGGARPSSTGPPPFTAADAEAYGIKQPVGGNNAWRSGAPTTAGPGFTTYHDAGGARITNIHRMADLVRGAVIAPGASFSINDHVGERTAEKGFVAAGAIRDGQHVEEIGGGVSQFATTMFNAAYFAGLQIDTSQAHSEYFDRYPRGREATMGFPAPDLAFTNDTPYGIMIWTSYTETSLTVTLYSTPYATAEQTGIVDGTSGKCTTVTTTRTITYPDGRTAQDKFRATYRPRTARPAEALLTHGRRAALRVPDERLGCAHVDDREGPAAPVHDHRRLAPRRPGRRDARSATRSTGRQPRHPAPAPAGRRQPVLDRAAALGGRPQLRPRLPPPRRERRRRRARASDVLELAQWVGDAGLRSGPTALGDVRRRRAWPTGAAALIQKLHHAITDGVGSIQIALHPVRPRARRRATRARCPTPR